MNLKITMMSEKYVDKKIIYCIREGAISMKELKRGTRKVLRVKNMFTILFVVMVSWVYIDIKSIQIIYTKHKIICQLYFNKPA